MLIFTYILVGLFVLLDLFLVLKFIEYIYCAFFHGQPPMVASNKKLRQMVANQINKYYPNAYSVCEIGAGFGGMARYIARHTNATVTGIENMPFSVFVSKFLDIFSKSKTVWGDAFEYMDKLPGTFDIGIAYLGPKLTPLLKNYTGKMHVLISLDFKVPGIKPVRVVDMGYGNTIYRGKKYPHKLFIYEF